LKYTQLLLGGMESKQEILLAWQICQVEKQVQEQLSVQDRALMIGMMARGKIIRNDGWSFPLNECESANVGQESQNDSGQLEELQSMFLTEKRCFLS
jgi:hypothetical protein